MAFFRKWKQNYKHKKFTSDAADGEDWGLGEQHIKDMHNHQDLKLGVECIEADDEDNSTLLFATYTIKYLGCTPIETKRSEKITSDAIKTVIANSKAGGRRNKTQKRVLLNVSPDGIEVLDQQTHDSLIKLSIYKVSYCSVDAAHDHAFSFVGSEVDALTSRENMSCHVFQCPKRKIAHEITLMVARCFENAYQNWRDSVVEHAKIQGINLSDNSVSTKNMLKVQNANNNNNNNNNNHNNNKHNNGAIESKAEIHQQQQQQQQQQCQQQNGGEHNKTDKLLINLAGTGNDVQKSWVSFEDVVAY